MIVLRVQDADGRGPYRPGLSARWSDQDGPAMPPWWVEIGIPVTVAMSMVDPALHSGCGFQHFEQFTSWFSDAERRRLKRLGFGLSLVTADKVYAATSTQVVFGCHVPLASFPRLSLVSTAVEAKARKAAV